MRSTSPVSRPAWVGAMNALTGTRGASRKSPVEIFADAASVVTRSPYAEVTGLKHGKLGRWTDGVAELRSARTEFAAYWDAHNDQVLSKRERAMRDGAGLDPLWSSSALDRAGPRRTRPARRLRRPDPVRVAAHDWQPLAGAQPLCLRRADARRARRTDTAAGRPASRPRHLRRGRERHPVQRAGQALRRPAHPARGGPGGHGHARPAAALRLLGDCRPHERPVHHPHQPSHPGGRDRAEAAGGRGQQALRPAVGRQVLRRQLPPEPGRLPRLVKGPGRDPHPGQAAVAAA